MIQPPGLGPLHITDPDQGVDSSTAVGRMFFQILGAISEFSVIWTRRDVCLPRWGLAA